MKLPRFFSKKKQSSGDFETPQRIAKECRALEQLVARAVPQGFERDEDILSFIMYESLYDYDYGGQYMKDASGRWVPNPDASPKRERLISSFEKDQLHNYFFITGQYEKARNALYYAMRLRFKDRDADYLIHFTDPHNKINWYSNNYKSLERDRLWGFYFYFIYYPIMHSCDWFEEAVRINDIRMEEKYSKDQEKVWAKAKFDRFVLKLDVCEEYYLWKIALGDFGKARQLWQEFFDGYDWYKAQHFKPRTSFHSDFGIYQWRPIAGAIKYWFEAMDAPDRREELARASLEHFQQWFIRNHIVSQILKSFPFFSYDILLSMMMRVDLGVDLDAAREFVRCFKPLFMAVPRIWEKVQALGVEYDPPQVLPEERIAELRAQFERREAERKERYDQFRKEIGRL